MVWLEQRLAVIRAIAKRPWVRVGLIIWAIIAAYDTFGSQFVPETLIRFPKMHQIIVATTGLLPWWAWFLILAAILVAAALEYAARKGQHPQSIRQTVEGETSRDWPIRELFAYIRPDLPLTSIQNLRPNVVIDGLDERWKAVGACVLKQLSLGKLHATGRQRKLFHRFQPRPIRADFWATAKFTYFFLDENGETYSHAENEDGIHYSEIEVSGSEASTIWERIPLRDAATKVHEELRDVDGFFNQGKNPDEKLDHVALFILQTAPVEVKKPPSTRWECLSETEMNQLFPGGGASWLGGDVFHDEATRIVDARVKRKDVERIISEHRQ